MSHDPQLEAWLQGLRGQSAPERADAAEAARIRQAVLALRAREQAETAAQLPDAEDFLQALERKAAAPRPTTRRRWARPVLAGLDAVLLAVVALRLLLPAQLPEPQYRGAASTPQLIVPQPAALAEQLRSQLQALGYAVTVQPQGSALLLKIAATPGLRAEARSEAAALLAAYELTLPPDGRLELRLLAQP